MDDCESTITVNGHNKIEACQTFLSGTAIENDYPTLFEYLKNKANEMGDRSFHVLDFGDVLWKIQQWQMNMPRVRPFYAVKTNSDPMLLKLFSIMGFSFDCASEGEIRMVLKAGGNPKNIIFAHTVKTPGALKYAKSVGVEFMTFDAEEELLKIHKHHPQTKLLLRLIPQKVKCSFDLSGKFGCKPEEAVRLLTRAKDLNLNVVGVSFHVGGLCQTAHSYIATIEASRKVFEAAKTLGFHFKILDIGGGFKGAKGTDKAFVKIAKEINNALDCQFPEKGIDIIAEPGTYFVASAGILVTSIIGSRQIWQNGITEADLFEDIERFYYLNDSIYGSFFAGIEEYDINLKPLLEESLLTQRPVSKCKLFGQTCCGNDTLVKEYFLPYMNEGECITWYNMGAYCHVLCSTFCGVPIPKTNHIFINNSRLDWKFLLHRKDVEIFILKSCVVIGKE